jgi:hypothetical protein
MTIALESCLEQNISLFAIITLSHENFQKNQVFMRKILPQTVRYVLWMRNHHPFVQQMPKELMLQIAQYVFFSRHEMAWIPLRDAAVETERE